MLKGLYEFSPISPKTLGFKQNENLLYLSGIPNDDNWLRVSNIRGQIGLVPINYVDVGTNITGNVVIDFLDESLQVARREKSQNLSELQDIRRNILNPVNDLERRLKEFKHLMTQLKSSSASSCSNHNSRSNSGNKRNGMITFASPPSFLTCDEPLRLTDDSLTDGGTTTFASMNIQYDDRRSERSGRTVSKKPSIPFIQYVNPKYDNESEYSEGMQDRSTVESDNDNRSMNSNESAITYTCSKSGLQNSTATFRRQVPKPPPRTSRSKTSEEERLDQRKLCTLIEVVRQKTGISHECSQQAVHTVLEFLRNNSSASKKIVQSDSKTSSTVVQSLLRQLEAPEDVLHKSVSFIRSSADYERLYIILCELSARAQDEELWEHVNTHSGSNGDLENILTEMNGILLEADKRVIVQALKEEDYENVYNLTLYFQKEHRWSRRKLLIQAFAKIASVDLQALSVLLNSVLPVELAREILNSKNLPGNFFDGGDGNRLETAGSLLGLLLSTGEKLPVRHLEYLGRDFLNFILDKIDNANDNCGDVTNVLINLLLAYNLQFKGQDENLTIATLATRRNAKFLTQKIVHLLLWEQDPVAVVKGNEGKEVDSVLKLLLEMFSCSMTADLFYTNDTKVLIDIVIRSLANWEPGEEKRTLYLKLVRMIIRNSNFREHDHRKDDLVKIFTAILLEEDPLAVPDQKLIREITNEFPALIK